jgi:hypothetical protein
MPLTKTVSVPVSGPIWFGPEWLIPDREELPEGVVAVVGRLDVDDSVRADPWRGRPFDGGALVMSGPYISTNHRQDLSNNAHLCSDDVELNSR